MGARIVIDAAACLNSGQCAYLQPEVFGLDDSGAPVILVDRPEHNQIAAVQEAIEMCPSQSISLTDD